MKNYYKIGYGNPCPFDISLVAILYSPAEKQMYEHCGYCRRSWKTSRMTPLLSKRIAEIDARYAKEHECGGVAVAEVED